MEVASQLPLLPLLRLLRLLRLIAAFLALAVVVVEGGRRGGGGGGLRVTQKVKNEREKLRIQQESETGAAVKEELPTLFLGGGGSSVLRLVSEQPIWRKREREECVRAEECAHFAVSARKSKPSETTVPVG